MFDRKTKRINKYYYLEKLGSVIWIRHQPITGMYMANGAKFFRLRKEAYQKIAELLNDTSFWQDAQLVKTRSIFIDLTRESPMAKRVPVIWWYDKPGTFMIWILNLYNWNPLRWNKIKMILFAKRVSEIEFDRSTFLFVYGR